VVDDKKIALQIGAVGFSQEDYRHILYGLPMGTHFSRFVKMMKRS
jgi:hypothetical protein